MSVKILIDMNLSKAWVPFFQAEGWTAVHWSSTGAAAASDRTILDWAEANGHAVFTHDLDFGAILTLTHRSGPSVLQLRGEEVLPRFVGGVVIAAIRQHEADLAAGLYSLWTRRSTECESCRSSPTAGTRSEGVVGVWLSARDKIE